MGGTIKHRNLCRYSNQIPRFIRRLGWQCRLLPEKHAFVAALNPPGSKLNDALLIVDVDPKSSTYGQRVGEVRMPKFGDELHHFGWNACSSALCPYAPHPHVERRYLVVPGIRSSRIHIIDIKPDPRKPQIVKVIEPDEVFARTNYSRPHTIHCGSGSHLR